MAVVKKKKVATKKAPAKKLAVKRAKKIVRIKKPTLKKKTVQGSVRIQKIKPTLERFSGNPIIEPNEKLFWESRATFNPSAIIHDGIVHLVYRAIGESDVSVLGYATSADGLNFKKKSSRAIYAHASRSKSYEDTFPIAYISGGGGSGGCEDPRLVKIGEVVYMTYTAFDGWNSVRIALTSIPLTDFIQGRWNWKKPVLVSAPDEINKNWVLFPEKINGKYAIIHSISPHVLVEYVKDLNQFNGETFIDSIHRDNPSWELRDRSVRGIGPAPIRTKYGWLVLYHGIEARDGNKYKLWAMLLDLKDPTKVLYKTRRPILEPEELYENAGYMGIVYSCGAVIKDDTLFVYYGGGDRVACVATANLDLFLNEIIHSGTPRLTPKK